MGRCNLFTPAAIGARGIHSNLYRINYFAKIRISKTKDRGEFHYTSPMIPACDNAR